MTLFTPRRDAERSSRVLARAGVEAARRERSREHL